MVRSKRPLVEDWEALLYIDAWNEGKISQIKCIKALSVSKQTFRNMVALFNMSSEEERNRLVEGAKAEYFKHREQRKQEQKEREIAAHREAQLRGLHNLREALGLSPIARDFAYSDMSCEELDLEIAMLEEKLLPPGSNQVD